MTSATTQRLLLACAPVACLVFVSLYLVAISRDPEYVLFESYISDLGVSPGAWAFNTGAVVAGALLVAFALGGFDAYLCDNRVMKSGSALMALSGAFLASVGIFTEDAGDTHLAVSYAFFASAYMSLAIMGVGRLMATRNPRDRFVLVSLSVFVIGVASVVVSGPDPSAETVAVFAMIAWGLMVPVMIGVGADSANNAHP